MNHALLRKFPLVKFAVVEAGEHFPCLEDEKRYQELKQAWLRDFPEVFKEDLGKEDRIDMDPVVIDLVPNHEEIQVFHPKLSVDVPAYMQKAAQKELQRMLTAGMLEPISGYTEHVSNSWNRHMRNL